jgi:transposase InsO family protein
LDIRHQRSDVACPWQNGRIKRFFGTLKQSLDMWEVDGLVTCSEIFGPKVI